MHMTVSIDINIHLFILANPFQNNFYRVDLTDQMSSVCIIFLVKNDLLLLRFNVYLE